RGHRLCPRCHPDCTLGRQPAGRRSGLPDLGHLRRSGRADQEPGAARHRRRRPGPPERAVGGRAARLQERRRGSRAGTQGEPAVRLPDRKVLMPMTPEAVFYAKGILSGLGVVLLVVHMADIWDRMRDTAQRARYLLLLAYGVLVAGASTAQVARGQALALPHWPSLAVPSVLVAVAVYSIASERARESKPQRSC